jgi:hypothetical protein
MVVDNSNEGHTTFNGATRQIAGTQNTHQPLPAEEEEPLWMKLATTAPCPAGCAMIRDIRTWVSNFRPLKCFFRGAPNSALKLPQHGGTPNLSRSVRAIPSAVFCAPWFGGAGSKAANSEGSLPRSVWEGLSPRGREVSAGLASQVCSILLRKSASFHAEKTGVTSQDEEVARNWSPDWRRVSVSNQPDGGDDLAKRRSMGLEVSRL